MAKGRKTLSPSPGSFRIPHLFHPGHSFRGIRPPMTRALSFLKGTCRNALGTTRNQHYHERAPFPHSARPQMRRTHHAFAGRFRRGT